MQPKLLFSPPLTQPGLLKVSGLQAKHFLQGQLTCHLDEINKTDARLGAHCNPQGRVLFLFRLFLWEDAYYFVLPPETLALALRALNKYAVFFKLTLEACTTTASATLWEHAQAEWSFFDLKQGRAQIYPETSGLFLPQELALDHLGGISWNKGCYTGQEIIARLHYRGKLKKQPHPLLLESKHPPKRGTELFLENQAGEKYSGLIVDYLQLAYNHYQVLLLCETRAKETQSSLDPQQNDSYNILKWLV